MEVKRLAEGVSRDLKSNHLGPGGRTSEPTHPSQGENILSRGCGPRFLWTDDCSRRNSGSKQDTARTFATIWEENPHLKGGLERNTDQVNAIPSRKAP